MSVSAAFKQGFMDKLAELSELSEEDLKRLVRILKKRYGKKPSGKILASKVTPDANWYTLGFENAADSSVFHPEDWSDHDLNYIPSFKNDDDALVFEG